MSEFMNLQAALGQTSLLGGLSGGGVRTADSISGGIGDIGSFGKVLGAVMADSMSGAGMPANVPASMPANASVSMSANMQTDTSKTAEVEAGAFEAAGDIPQGAEEASRALAELYGAIGSLTDEELPEALFTETGAKAFISVLERYISQGSIPRGEIEKLWQGVSDNEKGAYADILSAIAAGSVVLRTQGEGDSELEASTEEILGVMLEEASKLAMKPAAVPMKQGKDKDEEKAASYIMSVFIAPSFSVNTDERADEGISLENAVFTEMDVGGNAEAAIYEGKAVDEAVSGESEAYGKPLEENSVEADFERFIEDISEKISELTLEELGKFCTETANELKAEVLREADSKAKPITPEDIGRQAFMTRVLSPREQAFAVGVEAALSRNGSNTENSERLVSAADMTGAADEANAADVADVANAANAADVVDMANTTEISEANETSGLYETEGMAFGKEADVRDAADETDVTDMHGKRNVPDGRDVQGIPLNGGVQSISRTMTAEELDENADTPVSPMDTEEIARRISECISRGREESITLRLSPEELGEIKVTVSRKAGETVVAFEAHKSESAQLIGDRAAALAESLSAKGIAVREISVTDMSSDRNYRGGSNAGEYRGGRDSHGAEPDSGGGASTGANAGKNGYSRHFYFEEPEETAGDENYYYNKEANLWLSI